MEKFLILKSKCHRVEEDPQALKINRRGRERGQSERERGRSMRERGQSTREGGWNMMQRGGA